MSGHTRVRRGARVTPAARTAWYVACLAALATGLLLVVVGARVSLTPEPEEPIPLAVGAVFVVPARVDMVGPLVVYGTPGAGVRPSLADLGCQVTEGGGPLSTERAATEDRIVAAGRGLTPLVSFPGREGHSLACGGPAAAAAAPLLVAPGDSSRDLVPVAAFSVAALLLPVGGAGLLMLRASRP